VIRALAIVCVLLGKMPSLEDAFARHGPAIVGVKAGDARATGFFVTSSGLFATVVSSDVERVDVTFADGSARAATRVVRDESGLALYALDRPSGEIVAALALAPLPPDKGPRTSALAPGAWLLALAFEEGRASPMLGGMRARTGDALQLDLPCDAGAPVLVDDRVVAIVTKRTGKTASVGVDVRKLLALAEQVRPTRP
jgi:hypothetical protein